MKTGLRIAVILKRQEGKEVSEVGGKEVGRKWLHKNSGELKVSRKQT